MLVKPCYSQVVPIPEMHLLHGSDKARSFLAKRGYDPSVVSDASGQCIPMRGRSAYDSKCLVVLNIVAEDADLYGLLAHEAYHATIFTFEDIGEEHPGEEITAYVLQTIVASLIRAHEKYERKHRGEEEHNHG